MSVLLYQKDSYHTQFTGDVLGVDPDLHAVILNKTCFYPGGGGQPFDTGTLFLKNSRLPIIKVRKNGDSILHLTDEQYILPGIGETVTGTLDWDRRYKLMRTHTALHILCGVVFRDYGALVTGGDMDLNQGRMDFEFENMQKELVQAIETAVNVEVEKQLPIKVQILPRNEALKIPDLIRTKINLLQEGIQEIRTVEIVGLDLQADGGTHVKNTMEVGFVKIVDYKSKGKINKRIYLKLD
jgi:misacylated tRNA(Ala) deacylase